MDARTLSALPEAVALARRRLGGELAVGARPTTPVILIGYQQALRDLDLQACRRQGVEVGLGRRFCAGDAFLVGTGDLAFAFGTTRGSGWGYRQAVDAALGAVAEAIVGAGAEATVKLSSVLVRERRVAGATAIRRWGGQMICGYVLLNGPLDPFAGPLMLSAKELAANYGTARDALGRELAPGGMFSRICGSWSRRVGETETERSGREELKELDELAAGKYSQERWLGVR
jgi:lipoate-protein ligase A